MTLHTYQRRARVCIYISTISKWKDNSGMPQTRRLFVKHGTAPLELVAGRLAHSRNSLALRIAFSCSAARRHILLSIHLLQLGRLLAQRLRNSKFFSAHCTWLPSWLQHLSSRPWTIGQYREKITNLTQFSFLPGNLHNSLIN